MAISEVLRWYASYVKETAGTSTRTWIDSRIFETQEWLEKTSPKRWSKIVQMRDSTFSFWYSWFWEGPTQNRTQNYSWMVGEDKVNFIRKLLALESTTNENIEFAVTKIAEYWTCKLLEAGGEEEDEGLVSMRENIKIPSYFAYLCKVYKGVHFNSLRIKKRNFFREARDE